MIVGPNYTAQSIYSWQGDIFFNVPPQLYWISCLFNHSSDNSKFPVASIPPFIFMAWIYTTQDPPSYFILYVMVWETHLHWQGFQWAIKWSIEKHLCSEITNSWHVTQPSQWSFHEQKTTLGRSTNRKDHDDNDKSFVKWNGTVLLTEFISLSIGRVAHSFEHDKNACCCALIVTRFNPAHF
jgi:hypothetical protein